MPLTIRVLARYPFMTSQYLFEMKRTLSIILCRVDVFVSVAFFQANICTLQCSSLSIGSKALHVYGRIRGSFPGTSNLTLFPAAAVTMKKCFIRLTQLVNVIKHFFFFNEKVKSYNVDVRTISSSSVAPNVPISPRRRTTSGRTTFTRATPDAERPISARESKKVGKK